MIEASQITGLLVLACTLQDVDPMLGTAVSEPHALSLVARGGIGVMVGWEQVDGQDNVKVARLADGTLLLTGLTFSNSSDEIWANLKPVGENDVFEMTWLMSGTQAKDGRHTAAVWSSGKCEQLVEDGLASQS